MFKYSNEILSLQSKIGKDLFAEIDAYFKKGKVRKDVSMSILISDGAHGNKIRPAFYDLHCGS